MPNQVLTLKQRIFILTKYYFCGGSTSSLCILYEKSYGDTVYKNAYDKQCNCKFKGTGSVVDYKVNLTGIARSARRTENILHGDWCLNGDLYLSWSCLAQEIGLFEVIAVSQEMKSIVITGFKRRFKIVVERRSKHIEPFL